MLHLLPLSGLLAVLPLAVRPQESAAPEPAFPPSSALAEGLSPAALEGLSDLVQGFVDDDEIVGAELLVLVNGRSVLHQAYGWRDREAKVPMQNGSVFCVRSMTKPLIGAAVLMLVDDKRIDLDDPVAKFLPAFDVEGSRELTVEHLLTHTGGLPMSLLLGENLRALDGIQAVAALGAGHPLAFAPGSAFSYSDQGTDTLTALIEVASGESAADFVRTRLLEPLGMHDSTCVMDLDDPLRERGCCKYTGSRGAWTRFWSPAAPPLFPFFLGSQGLYSTLEDYARFLEFWLRKGRPGRERLLASRLVRKALTPGPYPVPSATGFPGLRTDYGFLMQLWTAPAEEDAKGEPVEPGERQVVAFGHSGSDGTHAWAFPEQKAMVLYFTQSRGTPTGLRVEEALGELLLGEPFDPNRVAPPFEQYLGYYWEGEDDLYRAIVRDGDDLALEILGKAVVPLRYLGDDRWKFRDNPGVVLAFDRAPEGQVTGYHIGDHQEFRFDPSPELPGADEIAERVAEAHHLDRLETLGPMRLHGGLTIEKLHIEGEETALYAWPDRYRIDTVTGEDFGRVAYDGQHVRLESRFQGASTAEGERAEQMRRDSLPVLLGDWRRWYPRLEVIQRLEDGSGNVLIVRAGDCSAPGTTMYVHEATGQLGRVDGMVHMDGLGRIGRQLEFGDYRDVSGMLLPFRTEIEIANPMMGTIVTTLSDVELGVELDPEVFALRE